mmetsp:Transcript_25963/g.32677  ORF Transcript_25963/g.32677 Transcript_25963/m.32677 type:complete len:344 (+) Transcript_25963:65-1096(+)
MSRPSLSPMSLFTRAGAATTTISRKGVIKKIIILAALCQLILVLFVWKDSSRVSRNLLEKSNADRLVVYNSVGGANNLAFINHSRITAFPKEDWDCLIFMYVKEDHISDDDIHLINLRENLGCTVPRTPGMLWGTFLQFITPTLVANYDYIALVLDDVFIPNQGKHPVNIDKMVKTMEERDIHVMTPGIIGDTYGFINKAQEQGLDECIAEASMIETYLQIFTRDAWECYYHMLHYTGAKGWWYDMCYKSECPDFKLAYDFSMFAYHVDKENIELPKDEIVNTDLVNWKPDPKVTENGYFDSSSIHPGKIRERLNCDNDDPFTLKEIACPSPEGGESDETSQV